MITPFAALLAAATWTEPGADLRPRWHPRKSLEASLCLPGDRRTLELKLVDDCGAIAREGVLRATRPDRPLEDVRTVLAAFPGVRVEPMVRLEPELLRQLRERGQERSGAELADMSQYFTVDLAHPELALPVLAALLDCDEVENAYVAARQRLLGDVPPTTPDFTPLEGHISPAPLGIDVPYARMFLAGRGAGQKVGDVQGNWMLTHEDLSGLSPASLVGAPPVWSTYLSFMHGTAVVGIIASDADSSGVSGIAPDVTVRLSPVGPSSSTTAPAILAALSVLDPGDAIVITLGVDGPNSSDSTGQFGGVPAEYIDSTFDAVRTATASGVHVVAAAGNGSQDLDSSDGPLGHSSFRDKFDLSARDSGALLIAAAESNTGHARMSWSNFGRRIDAYSWGEDIASVGWGPTDLLGPMAACDPFPAAGTDANQWYTRCMGGTSGATPIVAGAVALINAFQREVHGTEATPESMRGLLRSTGTPSTSPGMSRQPDLREAIEESASGARLWVHQLPDDLATDVFPLPFADANHDGRSEWLAARFGSASGVFQGDVVLYDGRHGDAIFDWQAGAEDREFGTFVLAVSDRDGDGLPDVMVSAPGEMASMHVFSSGSGEALGQITAQDCGAVFGSRFGACVCEVADLDGDGWRDLAVGAPLDKGTAGTTGAVYLVSAASAEVLMRLEGNAAGDRFGTALLAYDSGQGQLDALAIGAPGADQGAGRVRLVSLKDATWHDCGPVPKFAARFGTALALDASAPAAAARLFVGAPGSGAAPGRVFLLDAAQGLLATVASGWQAGDDFGAALASTPDHDGDGLDDLLIGAPGSLATSVLGASLPNAGAVHLVASADWKSLQHFHGVRAGARFGTRVAGGDLDGRGKGDVMVGTLGSQATPGAALYAYLGD